MDKPALIIGGLIFVVMGIVHGVLAVADVFRPTQFAPTDDSVRLALRSTNVRFLRARANMWDAWLGFNLSHSLGMLVFGSAAAWLGLNLELVDAPRAALAIPVLIGFIYFLLSVRFGFYAPTVASAIATAFFWAAWWSH
ncbi:MAG: hypothetical protein FJ148_07955 [Deltaproteobacteria bacterium]|nr:hypothetical protein [Deltaproteobacteria bacterium]